MDIIYATRGHDEPPASLTEGEMHALLRATDEIFVRNHRPMGEVGAADDDPRTYDEQLAELEDPTCVRAVQQGLGERAEPSPGDS